MVQEFHKRKVSTEWMLFFFKNKNKENCHDDVI